MYTTLTTKLLRLLKILCLSFILVFLLFDVSAKYSESLQNLNLFVSRHPNSAISSAVS